MVRSTLKNNQRHYGLKQSTLQFTYSTNVQTSSSGQDCNWNLDWEETMS